MESRTLQSKSKHRRFQRRTRLLAVVVSGIFLVPTWAGEGGKEFTEASFNDIVPADEALPDEMRTWRFTYDKDEPNKAGKLRLWFIKDVTYTSSRRFKTKTYSGKLVVLSDGLVSPRRKDIGTARANPGEPVICVERLEWETTLGKVVPDVPQPTDLGRC